MDSQEIKTALLQIIQRADKNDDSTLVSTFVQIGPLIPLLKNYNNQFIFGRRGTGKTHVLKYLQSQVEKDGEIGLYIDMRCLGSSGSVYSNPSIPITQRAVRLVSDIIKEIHDLLINYITESDKRKELYLSKILPELEKLVMYGEDYKIKGETSLTISESTDKNRVVSSAVSISPNPSFNFGGENKTNDSSSWEKKDVGKTESYMDYQEVSSSMTRISDILNNNIWILIDEFSELDNELQLYLADILRRAFAPNKHIILKIAAIEHRTRLSQRFANGGYYGIEIGADFSSINLDDFLVFGNNQVQSLTFFRTLIYNHANSVLNKENQISSSNDLIKEIFTQENAFEELVYAAEGVPRDALNILAKAISIDFYNKISIPTVRKAARQWYIQDKQKSVNEIENASFFLEWIIQEVIGNRHAKAFLLNCDVKSESVNKLYDARILHIIKQGISSKDSPGMKYNAYAIDYGCYCDLINTTKQPRGLFEAIEIEDELDNSQFISVPKDDYRSIRRAILEIDKYPFSKKDNS